MSEQFQWVITAFVVLACLAFMIQAGFVIALYRVAKAMQGKVVPLAARAEPILDTTRRILEENRPRIAEISGEAVEIAKTARQHTQTIGVLIAETAERAKTRIAQIDETVDNTVEQVEQVSGAVKTAVLRPVREVNAVMAGVRAAVLTYIQGGRRSSVDAATQDEEMFI